MLSTKTRLILEGIAQRIAKGESVSLGDRMLIQKWADSNKSAYELLRAALRETFTRKEDRSPTDQFLIDLGIGEPDPSTHKSGFDDPEDLSDFFKAPGWVRRS